MLSPRPLEHTIPLDSIFAGLATSSPGLRSPKFAIGVVDRLQQPGKARRLLDRPSPFERWPEHFELEASEQSRGDNSFLFHELGNGTKLLKCLAFRNSIDRRPLAFPITER